MKHGAMTRSDSGTRFPDLDMRRWFDALPSWFQPFEAMRIEEEMIGDEYVVRAEVPGIDPDKDADVWIADGILHVKAERSRETKETADDKGGSFRTEFSYGSFHRAVALPKGVGVDEVKATYRDGVLEVRVPMPKVDEKVSTVHITKE